MNKQGVVFLAATEYDNLGVGYIAAVLNKAGIKTRIIDFRLRKSYILKRIISADPILVGFSVIFLNHIDDFIIIAQYLRNNGINCHFTAGGHYASLKYKDLFKSIPQIDSIVRFEGEYTLLELVNCINSGKEWRDTAGMVHVLKGKIIVNPLRPVEPELDKFPYPCRLKPREFAFKKRFTTIIAGRGCTNNCSFCTTPEFYRKSSGPPKRIRTPENVVNELEFLYRKYNYSIFLFQDDDFPVKSKNEPDWINKFCSLLRKKELYDKIIWRISCRPDEIDENPLSLMKSNGLFYVFIGLEDGTDIGLRRLNKHITINDSLDGIRILKKLEIGFDYGFMLFQPDTLFESLYSNLSFLKHICSDGYTPATFLRLLPLYETPIEKELIESGRLDYSDGKQGYSFHEESMDYYYDFISSCFSEWQTDREGLENISKWAGNYKAVYLHFFDPQSDILKILGKIRKVIAESNLFMLNTMNELAQLYESEEFRNENILDNYRSNIKQEHDSFKYQIIRYMGKILDMVYN